MIVRIEMSAYDANLILYVLDFCTNLAEENNSLYTANRLKLLKNEIEKAILNRENVT